MAYKARMARKPSKAKARVRPAPKRAAPGRAGRKPGAPRTAGASEDTPYHHGALRDALLKAAETVLERDGLAGLTLRAVAREAGVSHPGMYGLMFRTERLDMKRPSLHEAAEASFAGLAGAIGASRQEQISEQALSLDQAAAIARAWSLVHGFTMLLLDDRLSDILRRLPKGTDVETLLDAMLRSTVGRPPGH